MMDSIKIRKVTSKDIEELQTIGSQTFLETFSDRNNEEDMEKYLTDSFGISQLTNEFNDNNSEFYFAIVHERIVGYLKINFGQAQTELKDANALEIERIYVLKEFHGKKVGQILYNKVLKIARQADTDYIWLGVWEKNLRAINFYKKLGFEEFDKHVFKLGNDDQTDLMMKIKLSR